jgi:Nucleoside 2-deoxyribosyltransferase
MKYYIASPGFTDAQRKRISEVEETLDKTLATPATYYSPFTHGGKLSLGDNLELNKIKTKLFFDENIDQIDNCDKMIAIVGEDDKGTNFEIGYFIGRLGIDNLTGITDRLLLIDDTEGRISIVISNALKILRDFIISDNTQKPVTMDLTRKEPLSYILLGAYWAMGIPVITYSSGELETNLMTSCSTVDHISYPIGAKRAIGVRFDSVWDVLEECSGELFNLHHIKFKTKVE